MKEREQQMKKKKIVMFGDSLTDYFPMQKLTDIDAEFINSGAAGNTVPEMKARVRYDVLSFQPDIVIMQGGANDFQMSLYRGSKVVAGQLADLGEWIRRELPEVKIYIESLYPAYTKRLGNMPSWAKEKSNEEIRRINEEIRRQCEERRIEYVDMYSRLAGEDGELPLAYTVDGIHLTDAAYDIVSECLHELLKDIV